MTVADHLNCRLRFSTAHMTNLSSVLVLYSNQYPAQDSFQLSLNLSESEDIQ
jgi:hypothetical protein